LDAMGVRIAQSLCWLGYRLEDLGIEVRFPAGTRDCSNLQWKKNRKLLSRDQSVRGVKLTTHLGLVSKSRIHKAIYLHSPIRLHDVLNEAQGQLYVYLALAGVNKYRDFVFLWYINARFYSFALWNIFNSTSDFWLSWRLLIRNTWGLHGREDSCCGVLGLSWELR
jgi:hypothetical protein